MNISASPGGCERQLRKAMTAQVDSGAVPGLVTLVGHGDEAAVEAYGTLRAGGGPPMRADSLFRIASMTKPIVAAAALTLVDDGLLRLDEPVDRLLPELADRRVLTSLAAPLGDTVPARRSLTVRDVLTFRTGIGAVMAPPGHYPIQRAMEEAGLAPGPDPTALSERVWLDRLGALPLMCQPGTAWHYHTGFDVLGILIGRAAGSSFDQVLAERILDPLGMKDTSFSVPDGQRERLPVSYRSAEAPGSLVPHDEPGTSRWDAPPAFPSGAGGLLSTALDYFVFYRMLLQRGRHEGQQVLSAAAVTEMTRDQLTADQRAAAEPLLSDGESWGLGVGVRSAAAQGTPHWFGWAGGIGTWAYAEPARELTGILLTQRLLETAGWPSVFTEFRAATGLLAR